MGDNELKRRLEQRINDSVLSGWNADEFGKRHTMPCISFRDYMELCLYDEPDGYYRGGNVRIGKKGDFYTSSAIGAVMAGSLASYIVNYRLEHGGPFRLMEWGAGTGRLSAQIAQACLSSDPEWMQKVSLILVDDNPVHRETAVEELESAGIGGMQTAILPSAEAWAMDWNGPTVVIANELLDALPVHRVQRVQGELHELGVARDGANGGFQYVWMRITDERIEHTLERSGIILRKGQITEVNLAAEDWLRMLGSKLGRGRLILIDYGHEAQEYAAEHRMFGTLLCYWKHQASDNPLVRPGEQDITAHVNFTQIRQAAERLGWKTVYNASQKQFLLDNGIMDMLRQHDGQDPFGAEARMNRAVRQLLLSDQMSETFKVMVLEKSE
ncbi:class I SAM-dependent methyltransferase [Paenibacillus harenae]|uniref:class I SAM-dependent methyltransferase n=1 Tax=Paenibacillus harenae TaxID=306543 RepID=UPI0027930591|nr:SAM-dependent methyltransferase [Paenibacillus harenae]MDQ0059386.1 SAM-dependent MidA family methyltransferase [Paenibacillus harenae]